MDPDPLTPSPAPLPWCLTADTVVNQHPRKGFELGLKLCFQDPGKEAALWIPSQGQRPRCYSAWVHQQRLHRCVWMKLAANGCVMGHCHQCDGTSFFLLNFVIWTKKWTKIHCDDGKRYSSGPTLWDRERTNKATTQGPTAFLSNLSLFVTSHIPVSKQLIPTMKGTVGIWVV